MKATARMAATKVKPAIKRTVPKLESSARPIARRISAKPKAGEKKSTGFIQTVKDGVHMAIETVGEFFHKATPADPASKSAKSKR